MISHRKLIAVLVAAAGLGAAASAQVTLSDVSFASVQLGGRSYYDVTAMMKGPPSSPYVVPIEILYPVVPAEGNGTAIVDLLNNTPMRLRAADTGGAEFLPPTPIGRIFLGDDFIGAHGYVYVAIQWDREIIPFINFHTGSSSVIPSDADQISIVVQVASVLQQPPASLPGSLVVTNRIAFAYSAAAWFLLSLLDHPVLSAALSTSYSGLMVGGIGKQTAGPVVPGAPSGFGGAQSAGDLKKMIVNTETELELLDGRFLRGQSASYRCYEIAGVAHNPTQLIPMAALEGLPGVSSQTRQNHAAIGPAIRALMDHLRRWTLGTGTPPDSVTLGTPFNVHNSTDFTPLLSGVEKLKDVPRSASDGMALGGIRLPPIVVPVGLHHGLETIAGMPFSATTLGQMLSGTFVPYSDAQLAALYPTHAAYVQAITSAADAALANGWILVADRDAYVEIAQASAIGTGAAMSEADFLACFGL